MRTLENRLYYLAGLIDGEGHVSVSLHRRRTVPRKNGQPGSQMIYQVGVTNTDIRIINEVHSIARDLGITARSYPLTRTTRKTKMCWVVRFDGAKRAEAILAVIAPYLVAKRDRAELMLAIIRHRQATKDKRPALGPRSLPEDDAWLMRQLGDLKTLNRRGPDPVPAP